MHVAFFSPSGHSFHNTLFFRPDSVNSLLVNVGVWSSFGDPPPHLLLNREETLGMPCVTGTVGWTCSPIRTRMAKVPTKVRCSRSNCNLQAPKAFLFVKLLFFVAAAVVQLVSIVD